MSSLGDTAGQDYWHSFTNEYNGILSSKKVLTYDRKEEEWCTLSNFQQMYDQIYERMVYVGAAKNFEDKKHSFIKVGTIVPENSSEVYGEKNI